MLEALQQAQADGGEILTGGKARPDLGPNFVEPTIVRMPAQTDIVRHETFAPILYLLEYGDLDEAIRLHNDVPQGLSSAIFSESMRKVEHFLSASGSDCGIANVNLGTSGAKSGARSGERRRPEAAASRARTPGSNTCDARRTRSIGRTICRWRRGFVSVIERQPAERRTRIR